MKVLTKDVAAGTPVEFKFDASGSRFLIKNFTRSPISCKILDAVICIPANTSQMVATRQVPQTLEDYTDTITVTAQEASKQGVKIQCMDYRPSRKSAARWAISACRSAYIAMKETAEAILFFRKAHSTSAFCAT